jgi:hypothetical protein
MNQYILKVVDGVNSFSRAILADELVITEHTFQFKLVTGTLVAVFPVRITVILEIEDLKLRNIK